MLGVLLGTPQVEAAKEPQHLLLIQVPPNPNYDDPSGHKSRILYHFARGPFGMNRGLAVYPKHGFGFTVSGLGFRASDIRE